MSGQATSIINDNCSTSLMALIKGSSAIPRASSLLLFSPSLFFFLSFSLSSLPLHHTVPLPVHVVRISLSFFSIVFLCSVYLTSGSLFFFACRGFPARRLTFQRVSLSRSRIEIPPVLNLTNRKQKAIHYCLRGSIMNQERWNFHGFGV